MTPSVNHLTFNLSSAYWGFSVFGFVCLGFLGLFADFWFVLICIGDFCGFVHSLVRVWVMVLFCLFFSIHKTQL